MTINACPDAESLRRLLQGALSGPHANELEEHLLQCSHCLTAADLLAASDPISASIRDGGRYEKDCAVLAQAVERVKRLTISAARCSETIAAGPDTERLDVGSNARDSLKEALSLILRPPEHPEEIGRLGGYRIFEVLGAGGMGIVMRAEDVTLQRTVAIKAMHPRYATSKRAGERFLREARAAAAIEHENIITIHFVGYDRDIPFLVMPLLRGESLRNRIQSAGSLPVDEVLRIGRQIAAGLAAAHDRGLIHRDIKPDNIWLEEGTNRVKILDFGLARTVTEDVDLTHSGTMIGTPRYMSPEQITGGSVDPRSDLFSLGSVMYMMCTGHPPFPAKSVLAALRSICDDAPRPVREANTAIPPALAHLIDRLLSKDPGDRPPSAHEILSALDENSFSSPVPQPAVHAAGMPKLPGTRRALWIVASSAILLALFGVIVVIVHKNGLRTTIDAPPGSQINVQQNGKVEVVVPESPVADPVVEPASAAASYAWPPPPAGFENRSPTELITSADWEWTQPVAVGVNDVNWGLYVAPDGLTMLYSAILPGGLGEIDLWMRLRDTTQDPWSPPVNLGAPVNSSSIESAPCLSPDGLTLVFESHRSGGGGSADLWMSRRGGIDQPWSKPVNLGDEINAVGWQRAASMSPDGLTLYYTTTGAVHYHRLFSVTRRSTADAWESPRPVVFPGSDESWCYTPAFSSDGRTLFFTANRDERLRYCTRESLRGVWSAPHELEPVLGTLKPVTFPNLSRDGRTLMFVLGSSVYMTHRIPSSQRAVPGGDAAREEASGDPQRENKKR